MAVSVMAWVFNHSRAEPVDRLVLLAIADAANDTGDQAYPSMAKLTAKTRLHERSVQRSLNRLVALGELVVFVRGGPKGSNRYRVCMNPGAVPGKPPENPGTAPGIVVPKPRHSATPADSHPGTAPPLPRHSAGDNPGTAPPDPSLTSMTHPEEPSSATKTSPTRRTTSDPDRPDVDRICTHLADKIAANGSKRPTITTKWRTAARLMLDADGRTVDKVIKAIDWCQADEFWRANVLSMPTLREQYDRLRLAAQRAPNARASPRVATTDQRVSEGLTLAERFDAEPPKEITAA